MAGITSPRIIFIVGWGRSGSTLLGNAIGELDDCVHVGEMHDLWSAFAGRLECGCGSPLPDCTFWQKVAGSDPTVHHALFSTPEDVHRLKQRNMRIRFTRRILDRAAGSAEYQSHLQEYADLSCQLIRSVSRAAGANIVVDSTKSPAAAALLLRMPLEVGFIHLVRDPRATGYSWQRQKHSNPAGTRQMVRLGYGQNAASWIYWNAVAELIRRQVDPRNWLRVRYEDFTADPEHVMNRITERFQLPNTGWPLQGHQLDLGTHHTVEGNPSRFKTGPRAIVTDDQWSREMPSGARALTVAITAPLFIAYGYRKAGPSAMPVKSMA